MSDHLSEADFLRVRIWYRLLAELTPDQMTNDDAELNVKLLRIADDPRAERLRGMLAGLDAAAFGTLERFLQAFPPAPG